MKWHFNLCKVDQQYFVTLDTVHYRIFNRLLHFCNDTKFLSVWKQSGLTQNPQMCITWCAFDTCVGERQLCCGKLEDFFFLQKHNIIPQMHLSNECHVNGPLVRMINVKMFSSIYHPHQWANVKYVSAAASVYRVSWWKSVLWKYGNFV